MRFDASQISCILAILLSSIAFDRACAQQVPLSSLQVIGDPSIATCPTANCPAPPHPPTLASQVVHGRTTRPAAQDEWLSTLGLLIGTGAKTSSDPLSGQKVTQYIGAMQMPGAGAAWALNTDIVRNGRPGGPNSFAGFEGSGIPGRPGAIGVPDSTIGYELDFTNWDQDSIPGKGPFTAGMYVHAQGSYQSLAGIYFDAAMVPGQHAWDSAILINGANVVRESAITDWSSATASYTIGGTHSIGLNMQGANANMSAVVMREGQTICLDRTGACLSYIAGKLTYLSSQGKPVFEVDDKGNAWFSGRITQGGLPPH